MNILIVSPSRVWGGAATANIAIAKVLIQCGNKLIFNDEYFMGNEYNGVAINHFPTRGNVLKQNKFISFVIDNKIDAIIWGNALLFQYYFPTIKKINKIGIKQITVLHSLSLSNSLRGRFSEWIVAIMSNYLNSVVCVSKYTKASWRRYSAFRKNENKMIVIPNSITKVYSSRVLNRKNKVRIGFVGRFSDEKQPGVFCSLSEICDYSFHAFGSGPLLDSNKALFPKVNFHGQVDNEGDIYNNIDILLVTSKFENCPMVILEAMSHGVPVVAPNVGGISEITNNGVDSILYEGYKPDTIIDALVSIVNDYERYSNNSINNADKYTTENVSTYWKQIIN